MLHPKHACDWAEPGDQQLNPCVPGPPLRGRVTVPRSPAGLQEGHDLKGSPESLTKSQGRESHPGSHGRFCGCPLSVCDIRVNNGRKCLGLFVARSPRAPVSPAQQTPHRTASIQWQGWLIGPFQVTWPPLSQSLWSGEATQLTGHPWNLGCGAPPSPRG